VTYDYLVQATAFGGAFIGVLLLIALWHTKPWLHRNGWARSFFWCSMSLG